MSALDKALNAAAGSYASCKAAVADGAAAAVLATSQGGLPIARASMGNAAEQLKHFRGWVYAAVRPIAQTIAGQPIKVGRRRKAPQRLNRRAMLPDVEELPSHPLLDLLADPNELGTAWGLLYVTVATLELTGKCLWWITEVDGRAQILPIPTSWITGFEGTTRYQAWKVRPPGAADEFSIPSEEAVYFHYPDPANPHGAVSPLQATAAAVDADESIQRSQVSMFERGIHPTHAIIVGKNAGPDGAITSGGRPTLTGAQRRQLVNSVKAIYQGASKHGEALILDGLIEDVKRLSSTPAEMDWLDSSKFLKARISQTFGTNPIIMGEVEGANRASSLEAERHFCKFTLNPKIRLISECLTEWLGPLFAADGQRLVIWIEPCVPRDEEFELRRMQALVAAEAVTVNELRDWAGLPALDWGDAPAAAGGGLGDSIQQMVDERIARAGAGKLFNVNGRANGHAIRN